MPKESLYLNVKRKKNKSRIDKILMTHSQKTDISLEQFKSNYFLSGRTLRTLISSGENSMTRHKGQGIVWLLEVTNKNVS